MPRIDGNNLNNTLNGTGGADDIYGYDGDDTINAGNGNDFVDGGRGNDNLYGGFGNDTLLGGDGNDVIDGGVGSDTASFAGGAAVVVNLNLGSATGQGADTLISIENVLGSSFNDTITGSAANNSLNGGDGDDLFYASVGVDNVIGGNGVDTLNFSSFLTASINAQTGGNVFIGGVYSGLNSGIENLVGGGVNDVLTGDAGANLLDGGAGADILTGGLGNDVYVTDGLDTLVESPNGGVDEVRANVSFTLANEFENLTLTGTGNINATGNAAANVISGNTGNNVLDGGAGVDTLQLWRPSSGVNYYINADLTTGVMTGYGTDTILNFENVRGTALSDGMRGDAGNNILEGMGGSDTLNVSGGVDFLDGGADNDAISFSFTGAATVNLANGTYSLDANNYGTFTSIEHVVGSGFGDFIFGSAIANNMSGGAGADVMIGGGGNDQIWGGAGSDRLIADLGNDTLVGNMNYDGTSRDAAADIFEVRQTAGAVTISDFKLGVDKLDLTDFGFDSNGVSPTWTGSAVQSGTSTVLTLTSLSNQVVTIRLQGVVEGYKFAQSDMIGGSASLIPPAPVYPINGGNGVVDNFLIDPNDIIANQGGALTINNFENGLDHLDVRSMNLQTGGYWGGFLANASNGDAILNFNGAGGEHFSVRLTGVPYYLIDQSDYLL